MGGPTPDLSFRFGPLIKLCDGEKNWKANLTFQRREEDQLTLDGDLNGPKTRLGSILLQQESARMDPRSALISIDQFYLGG